MVTDRARPVISVAAAFLLSGCPAEVDDPPLQIEEETAGAVCLQGEPFVAEGTVPLQNTGEGDATRLSGMRWEAHDGCERFVIDLAADEDRTAAGAGVVTAAVLRDLGVVRVNLRDVEWVDPDATDATFDGSLARAAYAVWSPDGRGTYVDVHLASEAEAHVAVLGDPARVIVDLRPGGAAIPEPAPSEQRVVVLDPRPGVASYPLSVTGYARTFEANVLARIEQDGEEIQEDFTTATAWADAWGHFEITFDDGPTGSIVLHVGEHSARDGTWEGVEIPLRMEEP